MSLNITVITPVLLYTILYGNNTMGGIYSFEIMIKMLFKKGI